MSIKRIQKNFLPLGSLEEEVMEYVWTHSQASVRDVLMAIKKKRSIAYTTVMTVMNRLYKKGLLLRTQKSNAYVYAAAVDRNTFFRETATHLTRTLIDQCGDVAIAQFVDTLESINADKLIMLRKELNKYIEQSEEQKGEQV